MNRATLSGYENGIAEPNLQTLAALSKYFGISVDTLIKKDLSLLPESQLAELERGKDIFIKGSSLRILATTVDSENEENIELVNEKAKAGYKNGYADPDYISELPCFQLPFLSGNKKYRTFQLSGDSMLPIPDKAWVTGEYLSDWSQILSGGAYIVLTLDEGIVFKIVENRITADHKIVLYSLNPLYEPFEVFLNEIREVWKFVNYISSEIPDPVLPREDLLATVARLKKDMNIIKRQMKT
jgi:transcriptional regulator with XRE-family HTH domain